MLLAGAMLLPANAFAASADDFSDFPSDWSAAGLRRAVDNGLLNGANGRIDGAGLLTRAQMAAIINRAFAAKKTADLSGYNDVSADVWYRSDLAAAVAMGTFQGANGQLNPERPITREEAFTVLARAFALESGSTASLNVFSDSASVSSWAADSAAALVENGYVNGANGALNPKSNITRAEFAKIISDMASTYADASASLPETVDGSLIVRDNSVSLAGKTINGDLIIADGVSQIDLSNVTVTGRVLLRGGESGVNFANTKAGKGIVATSRFPVRLTASPSSRTARKSPVPARSALYRRTRITFRFPPPAPRFPSQQAFPALWQAARRLTQARPKPSASRPPAARRAALPAAVLPAVRPPRAAVLPAARPRPAALLRAAVR